MGTKLTLTFAVGIFLVTVLLFAAAMVIANALSIPQPTERFLPFSARGVPETLSEQPSDDPSLANEIRSGTALSKDEPVPTVTAVPEPPSRARSTVSSGGARAPTPTHTIIDRQVTSDNGQQASQGPARSWPWLGLDPLVPGEPISTPSPTPTPRSATPQSPTSEDRASQATPSEPTPTEPAPSEPTATEPTASEPAATEPTPSEPTPSEPTATEPAALSASETVTESPAP